VSVRDVGEIRLGKQRTPSNRSLANPVKYLRAANITWDGLKMDDVYEMDFPPAEHEIYKLKDGDVLLSEASGSTDQVGRPAIWRGELDLCCFQNTVIRFRPYVISSEFAYFVFLHYAENGLFARMSRGVGIGHLGADRLAGMPFPLPSLAEQGRVVATLQAKLDNLKQAQISLESAGKKIGLSRISILDEALSNLKDSTGSPQKEVRLHEILTATNGRSFRSTEWDTHGLPIIRIQNLRDPEAPFNYYSGTVDPKNLVNPGDLLFAWSGTPGTSFGAFIWRGPLAALNQHIFKLVYDPTLVDRDFLFYSLQCQLDDYVAAAKGGGGLGHLSRGQFMNSMISLPALRIQKKIAIQLAAKSASIDEQAKTVAQSLDNVGLLRRSLLEQAATGRLSSPRSEDEPVDVLLTQIENERSRRSTAADLAAKLKVSGRGPRIKMSATGIFGNLTSVLRQYGPLTAVQLYERAGYDPAIARDMERFYEALMDELSQNHIERLAATRVAQERWQVIP